MSRVKLSDETLEELETAKEFYYDMEERLNHEDVKNHKHRCNNRKMDRDYIIREALKSFNKKTKK